MINVNSLLKNALKILIIVLNVKVLFIENNCFSNCPENITEREGICLSCDIYELVFNKCDDEIIIFNNECLKEHYYLKKENGENMWKMW